MSENDKMGCVGPIIGGVTVCALIFNWFGIRSFVDKTTGAIFNRPATQNSAPTNQSNSNQQTNSAPEKQFDRRLVGTWDQNAETPMWTLGLGPQGAGWYLVYVRQGGDVVTEKGTTWFVEDNNIVCDEHSGIRTVQPISGTPWTESVSGQRYRFSYKYVGYESLQVVDGGGNLIDLRRSRP